MLRLSVQFRVLALLLELLHLLKLELFHLDPSLFHFVLLLEEDLLSLPLQLLFLGLLGGLLIPLLLQLVVPLLLLLPLLLQSLGLHLQHPRLLALDLGVDLPLSVSVLHGLIPGLLLSSLLDHHLAFLCSPALLLHLGLILHDVLLLAHFVLEHRPNVFLLMNYTYYSTERHNNYNLPAYPSASGSWLARA